MISCSLMSLVGVRREVAPLNLKIATGIIVFYYLLGQFSKCHWNVCCLRLFNGRSCFNRVTFRVKWYCVSHGSTNWLASCCMITVGKGLKVVAGHWSGHSCVIFTSCTQGTVVYKIVYVYGCMCSVKILAVLVVIQLVYSCCFFTGFSWNNMDILISPDVLSDSSMDVLPFQLIWAFSPPIICAVKKNRQQQNSVAFRFHLVMSDFVRANGWLNHQRTNW